MSELSCKNCNRHHMNGLSCFYGISKENRAPVTKSNPSPKHSSARKLLKNKFSRNNEGMSFKSFVRFYVKRVSR